MARLNKDSLNKIEQIVKLANDQAHLSIKEVTSKVKKSVLIVKKELDSAGLLNHRSTRKQAREVSELADELLLLSVTLQKNITDNGAKGLEIHSKFNDIENIATKLDMLYESDNLFKEIVNIKTAINNSKNIIAKTGFIEPIVKKEKEAAPDNKIPQRLQDIIATISSFIEAQTLPEISMWRCKAYLGRIIKVCHQRGEEYQELIKDDLAEPEEMLKTILENT